MPRRSPTATAENISADCGGIFHLRGEICGREVENGFAVDNFRHTAVWVENYGDLHGGAKFGEEGLHFYRPEAAV
jgi:hypothetical protein